MKKRRLKYGAFATDCHGNLLHHDPRILCWGPELVKLTKDVELQLLGMVEVRVVNARWESFHPVVSDPNWMYQDWNAVLNEKYRR